MKLTEFWRKLGDQIRYEANPAVEALIDTGNGIDYREEITDIVYDHNHHSIIIYIKAKDI